MSKQYSTVTKVVAAGVGAAVFFVLFRFLAIPSPVPNTTIQVAYGFLAVLAGIFGPLVGAVAGFLGHFISDSTTYGVWWSWVITSGCVGFGLGLVGKAAGLAQGFNSSRQLLVFQVGQVLVNLVCWGLIAPSLDVLIYAEPASKVYVQGVVSALVNAVAVGVLGAALLLAYAKSRTASGSLSLEESAGS